MRICIDPGHGGKDPGAIGPNGLAEAEVALDVGVQAESLLTDAGHRVLLTRESDDYETLSARAAVATLFKADIFISIHCNAFSTPLAHGIETWHYTGSMFGEILAQDLQDHLSSGLALRDRGVKATQSLYVLRKTSMPAALVELGFMTNPIEAEKLRQPEFRRLAAQAITQAVHVYVHRAPSCL